MEPDPEQSLVDRIDALLPQTQCCRCGYPGCHPYAAAIARGAAEINRCPPGGEQTIVELAALLGAPLLPLDRSCGETTSLVVARVDESACIGCTLCIAACPVDAIIGAAKRMHTVLADRCTGCELCVPPCPVDCIALLPAGRAWSRADADIARQRFAEHGTRRGSRVAQPHVAPATPDEGATRARRRAEIGAALERALERARARRAVSARSRS